MQRISRLAILLISLLLVISTVIAQENEANVTITPQESTLTTPLQVEATGLEPGVTYEFQFIFAETDEIVFSTELTADDDGNVILPIMSEESDALGLYLVRVIGEGNALVAEGEFTLIEGAPPAPPEESELFRVTGDMSVVPTSAQIGETYFITVRNLAPFTPFFVEIREDATNATSYRRRWVSDENGRIQVEVFATQEDAPGQYNVTIFDQADNIVASDFFIVESPIGLEGSISVVPANAPAGTMHTVVVTDLAPFADVSIVVQPADSATSIYEQRVRADVQGDFSIDFETPADAEPGAYNVIVQVGDIELVRGGLLIGDAADLETRVTVTPDSGGIGTNHTIDVAGLIPSETFMLSIVLDETDEELYTTERTANSRGGFSLVVASEVGDPLGDYRVEIIRDGAVVAEAVFTVTDEDVESAEPEAPAPDATPEPEATEAFDAPEASAESDINLSIVPDFGFQGDSHTIDVSGLNAEESFTLEILYDGEVVFTTERAADESGTAQIVIRTEASDAPGTYTLRVVRDEITLAESTLLVEVAPSTAPEADTQAVPSVVEMSINPATGGIGTAHVVDIRGLDAEETVVLSVAFEGETILSSSYTADENGNLRVTLTSEPGDEPGAYTVAVLRADAIVAEAALTVEPNMLEQPGTAQQDQPQSASVIVEPDTGAIGDTHNIEISGLLPGETVTIDISFDGETVFATERTADELGELSIIIATEESDAIGSYQVSVIRDNVVLAEAGFVVEDQATAVAVPSGALLQADDALTLDSPSQTYRFSGEVGQIVSISLVSDSFDSYLSLLDENGVELAFNDDGGGGLNALIGPFELPYTGEYELFVSSYSYAQFQEPIEGAYTVQVNTTTVNFMQMNSGINGTISENVPMAVYQFDGSEGDVISIALNSNAFDSYLILQDEGGFELASNDDGGGGLNAFVGPYVLPYSGQYTLIVSHSTFSADPQASGDFTLVLETADLNTIQYNEPLSVDFDNEESVHYFTFTAEVGDVVDLVVDSGGSIDTVMSVTSPDNVEVALDDDSGAGYDPEVTRLVTSAPGEYLVAVRAFNQGDLGRVELSVKLGESRALNSDPLLVRLNSKQFVDTLFFQGTAGETVTLHLNLISGNPGDLSINVTQNKFSLMSYASSGIPEQMVLGFVVPEDGVVSILVEELGVSSSVLELSIEQE